MDMSEKSQSAMHSQKGVTQEADKNEREELPRCIKLQLHEHLQAYIKKNPLVREHVESVNCNQNVVDKVILNYIIVKQILSNLDWQDKMLCNHVCTTWHSAVQTLSKENCSPEDFVIDFHPRSLSCKTHFRKSGNFNTEPLVVITFANISGCSMTHQCKNIDPKTCQQSCKREHCFLDIIYKYTCAPKDCMIAIRSDYLSYMPLPQSITSRHTITHLKSAPFIGGLYIPLIPQVQFHKINIKSYNNMNTEFFDVVDRLSTTRIFKGIIVFVTDKYLLHTVEDIIFLKHFKKVQPDIPYALGGCIIDDAIFEHSEVQGVVDAINENKLDYVSENLISIAAFTVPKTNENIESNFDMFSFILDSSEWSKAKIEYSITEFSKQVPRYEHSAAIKLSCVGRDQKHKFEQDCFRVAFPKTPIVGCYGNGELGINHPVKQDNDAPAAAKRNRRDPGPQFGIMYSYSSVFMYMGWGKITSPMGPTK